MLYQRLCSVYTLTSGIHDPLVDMTYSVEVGLISYTVPWLADLPVNRLNTNLESKEDQTQMQFHLPKSQNCELLRENYSQ